MRFERLLPGPIERLWDDRMIQISVAAGWHTHPKILADRLKGKEPSGFWVVHTKMEKEYEQRLSKH